MTRHNARSGVSQRVNERQQSVKNQPAIQKPKPQCTCGKTVKKQDMGDLWVLAVFFLLYLESRDTDFLIILAVLAFSMFDMGGVLKGFGINL